MKIGDYVRFDGEIAKIKDIKRYKTKEDIYVFDRILDLNEDRSCNDNTIYNSQWKYFDNVKSSSNIIDLIEVGDILMIKDMFGNVSKVEVDEDFKLLSGTIVSIVTKEQFESMEYKVGE